MPGTIARWRAAGEARRVDDAVACLSADVRLVSPITDAFAFAGRDEVATLLDVAFGVVDELRYTDEVSDGETVALFYDGRLRGEPFAEAQRLRLRPDGLIGEITLYVRPLPGLTGLMAALGPELARRHGHPGMARVVPLASGVVHGMARTGERRILPATAP